MYLQAVLIPPGFHSTTGVVVAIGFGPWARGSAPQALGERNTLLAEAFEVADDFEALQRDGGFGVGSIVWHGRRVIPPEFATAYETVLWEYPPPDVRSQVGAFLRSQRGFKLR